MSHQITNNMLAYKGETPWHGLGVSVTADMTGEAMLVAAQMNWKVQRRALAMRGRNGEGLISDKLSGFRAIVREDTDEVFQVATDRYFPVQNAQIVEFFREYCEAGHASLETVGALQGGRKVWALAKLNGGSATTLQGVDDLRGYMLLATSHDGSLQTVGQATQVRVVCYNTLLAALALGIGGSARLCKQDGRFMMKHSAKWTSARADEARKIMGMAIDQIAITNELADKLSRVSLDESGRTEYVARLIGGQDLLTQITSRQDNDHATMGVGVLESILVEHEARETGKDPLGRLGKAILEAIIDSPGSDLITAKDTMWGALNGVTYYTDHVRGRSQDTRLVSAWFGQSNQLKSKALKVACEMSGIDMPDRQSTFA